MSFVGSSGVGKTTVLERLIPLVRAHGLRVGTVKHAPHGHQVDREGSDSWRHRQAGAEAVLLAGANGAVLFLAANHDLDAVATGAHHAPVESANLSYITAAVTDHLGAVDVVLAEGFAPLHDLMVEVRRRAVPAKLDSIAQGRRTPVWLTITDEPTGRADEYSFDELAAVAARITAARITTERS